MSAARACHPENPSSAVAAVFARIARERMHDVPICNRALSVEVVGLRAWQGLWVGVVITPWAMNLLVLPGGSDAFVPLRVGGEHIWDFPSGAYAFMGHHEPGLGDYHYCSLFSPMADFADQAAARAVACASLDELFAAPAAEPPRALDRRAFLRTALGRRPCA